MRRKILLMLVVLLIPFGLFCQAVVPDSVYRETDNAIAQGGVPGLGGVLSKYSAYPWYSRLEDFVLKKARQLVIQDDLDQAAAVSLSVIDANLDNQDAVQLYQSIQRAREDREAERRKEEEKKALAVHKQQAQETKAREEVDKTYKAVVNPSSGKKVYLDQDYNTQYRKTNWDLFLGLAALSHTSDPDKAAIKYGLGGNGSFIFRGEGFSAGADISGEGMILTLSGDPGINWNVGGVMLVANNALSRFTFLRLGYYLFAFDGGSEDYEETSFNTPVVGFEFRDVRIGDSGFFQLGADWYAGHLFDPDIVAAMGFQTGMTFILAEMHSFDVMFRACVRDSLFLVDGGMRNDVKLTLSIGVGNYE
ncbi:MAG TPA: hypothetical protein PLV73_11780 [Treponemataceae bacterium]|nr:hypothetical protein [Treponemataceae bacterium]